MKKILLFLAICLGFLAPVMAQDVTEPAVKEAPKAKFTRVTFNATKLINMQTTEMVSKGALQFMISHHFSNIWTKDGGSQNLAQLFGLNSGVAHTYLSFDFSPIDRLNLGMAAAGSSKYEGWAKIKLLRQQTGAKNIPVSVALYSMVNVNTAKNTKNRYSLRSHD